LGPDQGHVRPRSGRRPQKFTKQIAFNVIPHIDKFMEDGSTKEEWKMVAETKKIVDPKIKVTATCVRVPVFVGHSEAHQYRVRGVSRRGRGARDPARGPGILVVDKREDGGYVTPVECVGDYATFISRIRQDSTVENGLNLWCVSDNLRKGAALNAVQIAETLGNRVLKKGWFLAWIGNRKTGFIRELSDHFDVPPYEDTKWLSIPRYDSVDGDFAMVASVKEGPDIWKDPTLSSSLLMSDRLTAALRDAGLLKNLSVLRCPVAE
jgi:hypothetical protein